MRGPHTAALLLVAASWPSSHGWVTPSLGLLRAATPLFSVPEPRSPERTRFGQTERKRVSQTGPTPEPAPEPTPEPGRLDNLDPRSLLELLRIKIGLGPAKEIPTTILLEETAEDVNNRTQAAQARYDSVVAKLAELKSQQAVYISEREGEIELIESYSGSVQSLKSKVSVLESDLAKTRKDLKASQSQKRELEYRLESMQGELREEQRGNTIVVNDLRKRLDIETKRAKELEEREASLSAICAEAQDRMDAAMANLTSLFEAEREEMGSKISSLTQALGVQTEAAETAQKTIERIKSSYAKDNQGLQRLLEKQRKRYASTFLEMDVRIRSLENDLDGYNELKVKDKERESKLVGLESELSETITALRKMTVDGEDVRRKLVVELEGRAIAEAQVATLQSLYDQETARLEASLTKVFSRLDVSEGERKKAEEQVKQLQAMRTEEKQRLDSLVLDFEKTIADKSGAMDTLQSELKLVMAQLNDSQRRSEEAEHMVAQLEKKREEDRQRLAELTSQYEANLEQKSEALESLEQRAASDEERIAALTATLGAIEGKLKTQAAEYQALMRQERAALEKEIDIYQSQARGYEMRANMEAANAKRERERLKRSVRVFTNELARLHSERQSVRRLLFTLVSTAFRKLRGKVDWEAKEVMDRAKRLAQEDSILSSFEKD